ncbi:MAG: hypothetical protein ACO3TM_04105 [Burkholderiaceae bacterium]
MEDDLAVGQAGQPSTATSGAEGQVAPRPKRRLKWSNKAGEIIRSNNAHEVTVVEGGTVAVSRKAIPQSSETRSIQDDFESAAPGTSSGYGRDRFVTAARGNTGDRFESGAESKGAADRYAAGQGQAGLEDRYAAGQAGAAIKDNYQGGPEAQKQTSAEGPSLQREGFQDRTEGGGDTAAINDEFSGAGAGNAINDRFQGGGDAKPIEDRFEGAGGPEAFNDRYQGGGDAEAINDRNQGGQAPSGKASGFVSLEKAIVERGRIELPEEALRRANSGHWGSRKPSRIDELLRKVPKPVFEPVAYFGDVEQIKQRLTVIREQTADIRKGLATVSVASSSAGPLASAGPGVSAVSRIRKVRPWQKKSPE